MTHDEMIAVITAHKNGKKIEFFDHHLYGEGEWKYTKDPKWNFGYSDYRVCKPRQVGTTVNEILKNFNKFIGKRVRFLKHAEGYNFEIFGKFEAGKRIGIVVRNIVLSRYEIHDVPSTEIYYED